MQARSRHSTAIRASRVIGTAVESAAGEHVGFVEDIILDKLSNSIVFAVVGVGRFEIGVKNRPVPWATLRYEPERSAYVVPFTIEELVETGRHGAGQKHVGDTAQDQFERPRSGGWMGRLARSYSRPVAATEKRSSATDATLQPSGTIETVSHKLSDQTDRLRERADLLWEQADRLAGRRMGFWLRAVHELEEHSNHQSVTARTARTGGRRSDAIETQ